MEQEILNIDAKVQQLETSLNVMIQEAQNIRNVGTSLKQHSEQHKLLWQNYQSLRFNELLQKCYNLDQILKKLL